MKEEQNALIPAWQAGQSLFSRVQKFANRLPGADIAREALLSVEDIAMRELRNRLDRLDRPARDELADVAPEVARGVDPRLLLTALLEEGTEQNRDEALQGAYASALMRLTADEALMLAAMSDGSRFPLIHVLVASNRFSSGEKVAENICTLSRRASVRVREHVPRHISHLCALGLVQIGTELKGEDIAYQTLEGDPFVRALVRVHEAQNRSLRFQRRSVELSPFGKELWDYCKPT